MIYLFEVRFVWGIVLSDVYIQYNYIYSTIISTVLLYVLILVSYGNSRMEYKCLGQLD